MGDALSWIIRIEGINFDAAIMDTPDLSMIRGASLAYEAAATWLVGKDGVRRIAVSLLPGVIVRTVYAGGSQAVLCVENADEDGMALLVAEIRGALAGTPRYGPDQPEYQAGDQPPTRHLCFAIDVTPVEGTDETAEKLAVEYASMKSRLRQMRSPSIPPVPVLEDAPKGLASRRAMLCPVDPMRPASRDEDHLIWTAAGQFSGADIVATGDGGSERIRVSARVGDLRPFGRTARRRLYPELIPRDLHEEISSEAEVAHSFADIVGDAPRGVPESSRAKMAVLHVDGAGFGKARAASPSLEDFAGKVQTLFISHLLAGLMRQFRDGARGERYESYLRHRTPRTTLDATAGDAELTQKNFALRFETLMLGGEDWTIVIPSWCLAETLDIIFHELAAFNAAQKVDFGLRVGALVCHCKTPIRRARAIAYDLCEGARDHAAASPIDIHVMESIDIPDGAFESQRRAIYGPEVTPVALAFDGARWSQTADAYRALSKMPRSQLYDLIRRGDAGSDALDLHRHLAAACERSPAMKQLFPATEEDETVRDLSNLPGGGTLLTRLKRLAELWDYVVVQPAPPGAVQ